MGCRDVLQSWFLPLCNLWFSGAAACLQTVCETSVGQNARVSFEGLGVATKDQANATGSLYPVTVLQGVIQEPVLGSLKVDVFANFFCGGWWLLKIERFFCSGQP